MTRLSERFLAGIILAVILFVSEPAYSVSAQQCELRCEQSNSEPDDEAGAASGPISPAIDPSLPLTVPDLPSIRTCGDLLPILSFFAADSDECLAFQSMSTLCGCPVPKGACELCPSTHTNGGNGGSTPMTTTIGSSSSIVSFDGDRPIPVLAGIFQGAVPTCSMYRSFLHGASKEGDGLCQVSQALATEYCGCSNDHSGNGGVPFDRAPKCQICSGLDADKELSIPRLPFNTCGELRDITEELVREDDTETCSTFQSVLSALCGCGPDHKDSTAETRIDDELPQTCPLCRDGSPVPFQDKVIPFMDPVLGVQLTCGIVEAMVDGMYDTVDGCIPFHSIGSYCGCPAVEDHCQFCDGEPFPYSNKLLGYESPGSGIQWTCEYFEQSQFQLEASSDDCRLLDSRSFLCGCNGGIWDYGFAANTEWKRAGLAWAARVGGGMAFVVSTVSKASCHGNVTIQKYSSCSCSCSCIHRSNNNSFTILPFVVSSLRPSVCSFVPDAGVHDRSGLSLFV